MSDRWDRHFLSLCLAHAAMSKDPSTRVGSVIVGPDREIRSAGFNGLPRGIADTPERLNDRDLKLRLVVHGEMNAVLAAARVGIPLKGCTLYLAATDDTGSVWGGPPCCRCVVEIIQAGIVEVVSYPRKAVPSRWHEDIAFAGSLLAEAGLAVPRGGTMTDPVIVLGQARHLLELDRVRIRGKGKPRPTAYEWAHSAYLNLGITLGAGVATPEQMRDCIVQQIGKLLGAVEELDKVTPRVIAFESGEGY